MPIARKSEAWPVTAHRHEADDLDLLIQHGLQPDAAAQRQPARSWQRLQERIAAPALWYSTRVAPLALVDLRADHVALGLLQAAPAEWYLELSTRVFI